MREVGAILLGGHTIDDSELKFGMAVTGMVPAKNLLTKAGAKPGDRLILTKPLGTSIAINACKEDPDLFGQLKEVFLTMAKANNTALEQIHAVGVHACTDITGFGLLGHLLTLLQESDVSAVVETQSLPTFQSLERLDWGRLQSSALKRNEAFVADHIQVTRELTTKEKILLCDAQTSGGLLACVPSERSDNLLTSLRNAGLDQSMIIGYLRSAPSPRIQLI